MTSGFRTTAVLSRDTVNGQIIVKLHVHDWCMVDDFSLFYTTVPVCEHWGLPPDKASLTTRMRSRA